ncbi:hypothetical protein ACIA8O_12575 [Kitasatospora sp. NPDC051853]|uniref:hypothetical protein n=1 Tax=Kitasatospora sp. NPDC051853 TaxID=3364058 RepID=UPI0037A3A4C2
MKRRALRDAVVALLAATALAATVPATGAAAADGPNCQQPPNDLSAATGLNPGGRLAPGAGITTRDNTATLRMQADGNLVLSLVNATGGPDHVLWASGTWGNPGAHADMQTDGNLVVYGDGGAALWSSGTWGAVQASAVLTKGGALYVAGVGDGPTWHSGTGQFSAVFCSHDASWPYAEGALGLGNWAESAKVWLVLQRDGNLVMYRKRDDAPIWQSGTYGKPAWRFTVQNDGNLVILDGSGYRAVWAAGTWANPGAHAVLQDDGNLVVYRRDGAALWASGTWRTAG